LNGGAWIKWNNIALGTTWHWTRVAKESTPTVPATMTVPAGLNTIEVAYREDGTKLDVMVFTNDLNFSPIMTAVGDPPPPNAVTATTAKNALLLSWTTVPGALEYTVLRKVNGGNWVNWANVIGGHTLRDPITNFNDTYCYGIIASGATFSTTLSQEACNIAAPNTQFLGEGEIMSLTPPLYADGQGFQVAAGRNSYNAVPTNGWARYDFRMGTAATVKLWAAVFAPTVEDDSFWVRVDRGAWVKWNDIKPASHCGWEDVHNSDAGRAIMQYSLAAGSHTVEFAYREDGAHLNRLLITDNLSTTPPSGCYD
jgi:hypothetical protein